MLARKTRITVETDTLLVIRGACTELDRCPECQDHVQTIALSRESFTDSTLAPQLRIWMQIGELHVWLRADQTSCVCLPSLMRCLDMKQPACPTRGNSVSSMTRRLMMTYHRWIAKFLPFSCFTLMTAAAIGAAWAQVPAAQPNSPAVQYAVIDLGTLGGSFSLAYDINDRGQIDGFSTLPGDTAQHSFLYSNGSMTDLGTLGGPNSYSFAGLNDSTQVSGASDTAVSDPNGEDFCGLGTTLICRGFVWQNGVMTPLATLGGNNSQVTQVNARGQLAGFAETAQPDSDCVAPQVLQFRATVWTDGRAETLRNYPGDNDGGAFWMNDRGDAVGASGSCGAFDGRYGVALVPKHALLWRNGFPVYLGSLGGQINNAAFAIDNAGHVVGASDLPGDQYQHAFLWQNGAMADLGTLPGDVVSAALGVNSRAQVTGVSMDNAGNIRAFLWQNGAMLDMNDLIPANSPLYLLHGFGINNAGEIVGFAYVFASGEVHGFLAVPLHGGLSSNNAPRRMEGPKLNLPERARRAARQWSRVSHTALQ